MMMMMMMMIIIIINIITNKGPRCTNEKPQNKKSSSKNTTNIKHKVPLHCIRLGSLHSN